MEYTEEEKKIAKLKDPPKPFLYKRGVRLRVLELRRSDPLHEKYTDRDIAALCGVSKQRVHQILTDYIQPHHRKVNKPDRVKSRYRDEEWWKHRKSKHKPITLKSVFKNPPKHSKEE